jgi:competence protein ComEC
MWIGMLSAAAGQFAVWPATLLNALSAYALGYVAAVAHTCGGWRVAVWGLQLTSPQALAAAYLLPAAALAGRRVRRGETARGPRLALGLALAALVAAGVAAASAGSPQPPRRFPVPFIDGGHAALGDGGPPGAGVVAALRRHGARALDVAVLTHAQEDHQGGFEEVLARVPVGLLLDGGADSRDPLHGRILALARAQGTRVVTPSAGQRLRAGDLRLDVLSPPARPPGETSDPGEDPNQRAIVLLASFAGLDVFLPADAESDVTGSLPLHHVDVLKVAHHGSADEGLPDLLSRLRPSASVIEVGAGNRYGHPTAQALRALAAGGGRVYRTDRAGDVELTQGPRGPVMHSDR